MGSPPAASELRLQLEYHRPIGLNPSAGRWRRYIDHLLDLPQDSFDLLVIDTAMSFLPAAQNNPGGLRKALNELRVIAGLPAGVLLLHQTSAARTRSRARGPLTAFADILIDLQAPGGDRHLRRRDVHGVGRYPGTLEHVAEWQTCHTKDQARGDGLFNQEIWKQLRRRISDRNSEHLCAILETDPNHSTCSIAG